MNLMAGIWVLVQTLQLIVIKHAFRPFYEIFSLTSCSSIRLTEIVLFCHNEDPTLGHLCFFYTEQNDSVITPLHSVSLDSEPAFHNQKRRDE